MRIMRLNRWKCLAVIPVTPSLTDSTKKKENERKKERKKTLLVLPTTLDCLNRLFTKQRKIHQICIHKLTIEMSTTIHVNFKKTNGKPTLQDSSISVFIVNLVTLAFQKASNFWNSCLYLLSSKFIKVTCWKVVY